jgi:hypothetical protein
VRPSTTTAALSPWPIKARTPTGKCFLGCVRPHHLRKRRSSQFYFTFRATPHLDRVRHLNQAFSVLICLQKHTVFGKLVGGENVLDALEKLPLKDGTERPSKTVSITEVVMCVSLSLMRDLYQSSPLLQLPGPLRRVQVSAREEARKEGRGRRGYCCG